MMDTLIARFPEQLEEALEIGSRASVRPHTDNLHHVYVAGLGGSGIGANFVAELIRAECKIPYLVGKGYEVPAYLSKNSLAIASSYSGNTEETLNSFRQILETGAKTMVVASGGKLIDFAKEKDLDYIQVPGNWPSPRACLGYSLIQQLCILNKLGFVGNGAIKAAKRSAEYLSENVASIREEAKQLAAALHNKIPIIYATDRIESVAVRWRQQLNENSKILCWHHVIPEMNHNELVGWKDEDDRFAVVYLRNEDDYKRNSIRIEINKKIIAEKTPHIHEVWSKGNTLMEQSMYLVHLGDWVSWYLSELRGVDAIEVDVIDYLKSELGKI